MKEVREKAFRLRLKGYSYNEIDRKLGVPKSTLSSWFSGLVLSKDAQGRLESRKSIGTQVLVKRNKLQTHLARQRAEKIQRAARDDIPPISSETLLVIGAVLYWAEGYKRLRVRNGKELTSHTISFVNADPDMIKAFLTFLLNGLQIPKAKIRLNMRLYDCINEKTAKIYWMRITGMEEANFHSVTYLVSGASKRLKPYNRLPYGTLQIEVCDTQRFHHVIGLIEGVKNKF